MKLNNMNPSREYVQPEFGSSFIIHHSDNIKGNVKRAWHYHPELQLVYIERDSGKIHIGQHLSYFNDGALVLIGSNLPHFGRMSAIDEEIVIQFKSDFLGKEFLEAPEMQKIKSLITRASGGIKFADHVRRELSYSIKELVEMNNFNRLIYFVKVLNKLAEASDYEILNVNGPTLVTTPQDNSRLNDIYKYVRANFNDEIKLPDIAKRVNMTEPSFCRYFKKTTNKTFTEFVNEFRIVHATKLLTEGEMSLTEISFECGFNNQSHFIRQFKKVTGQRPSDYRKGLLETLS